jgi:hypothetical protein
MRELSSVGVKMHTKIVNREAAACRMYAFAYADAFCCMANAFATYLFWHTSF